MSYAPQDSMSLWWLADAKSPQRIGTLSLQDQRRKVALSYDPEWIASPLGFALSEDLPLQPGLYMPDMRDTAVGAVDDARPVGRARYPLDRATCAFVFAGVFVLCRR